MSNCTCFCHDEHPENSFFMKSIFHVVSISTEANNKKAKRCEENFHEEKHFKMKLVVKNLLAMLPNYLDR